MYFNVVNCAMAETGRLMVYTSPLFEKTGLGLVIRPNLHRNSKGAMGWVGRNCFGVSQSINNF